MDILLINCPIRINAKPNLIPTGLAIISSILKQVGHDVIVLDINGLRSSKDHVENYIKNYGHQFSVIGISGMITTYAYQKWLINTIKKYCSSVILCGGGCGDSMDEYLIKEGAHAVFKGAGENNLLHFLNHTVRYNDINMLPLPDWNNLPMDIYLSNPIWGIDAINSSGRHIDMKQKASMNVISSRGCPYNCNFCYDMFGRNYKQRSVENVIEEIKELKHRYNVDFIGFTDDNMFVNKRWVLEFCNNMKQENILWGCHARINEVDDEILKNAYDAGCRWIGYGIESGSQKILDLMNKKVKVQEAEDAILLTREYMIYPNTTFIYGYPGECQETIQETFNFCKQLKLAPEFFHSTAYPGTVLYNQNENKILTKYKSYEKFVEALGDAKEYTINLTDMSDVEYFQGKEYLEKGLRN